MRREPLGLQNDDLGQAICFGGSVSVTEPSDYKCVLLDLRLITLGKRFLSVSMFKSFDYKTSMLAQEKVSRTPSCRRTLIGFALFTLPFFQPFYLQTLQVIQIEMFQVLEQD